jgi:hypothetical protein
MHKQLGKMTAAEVRMLPVNEPVSFVVGPGIEHLARVISRFPNDGGGVSLTVQDDSGARFELSFNGPIGGKP